MSVRRRSRTRRQGVSGPARRRTVPHRTATAPHVRRGSADRRQAPATVSRRRRGGKLLRASRADADPLARVIVELLARTGMRLGKLRALTVVAVVQIGSAYWLRIPVGKLDNDRYIPLHPQLKEFARRLDRPLPPRRDAVRPAPACPPSAHHGAAHCHRPAPARRRGADRARHASCAIPGPRRRSIAV